jgi:hypothetical protein
MRRSAILIAASGADFKQIESVRALWRAFIKSSAGGGWYEDEIKSPSPTALDVLGAVESVAHSDYSLVVFIGHGAKVKEGRPWKETRIELNDKETLLADRQLNTGTPRLTLVLDCCRDLLWPTEPKCLSEIEHFVSTGTNATNFRGVFEANLLQAEQGITKIYPTSENSSSFSRFLITGACEWCKNHKHESVLSWSDAVTFGQRNMDAEHVSTGQEIVYQGGRRLQHFPMAIGLSDMAEKKNEK